MALARLGMAVPVYNGVGASWMPRWMRALLTVWFILDFDEGAAEDHDLAYYRGEITRLEADKIFFAAMLSQANSLRARLKAYVIFVMVRAFGGSSYHPAPVVLLGGGDVQT